MNLIRTPLMEPRHPGSVDIAAESFEVDGLELIIFEIGLELQLPRNFTPAERAVAQLLCEGHDIASIASQRQARYRTIANQLASMYRKVGVHSGPELVAALTKVR